jgi:LEA14-like dessication related protein
MKRLMLAVGALWAVGCATVEVKQEGPPPTLPVQELAVVSQSLTEFHLRLNGKIESAEAVTLESAAWELVVDEKVVKSGTQAMNVSVPAGTPTEFALDQTMPYVASAEELKAMDTRGGSLLCALRGKLTVKGASKTTTIDFARSREVRVPRLPHVKFQELEAGRYSEDETGVTFHIGVVNPNPFDVKLTSMTYKVMIADKPVTESEIGKGDKVSPSSTGVFDIEAKANVETHGDAIKKLIKGRLLPYVITGELKTELYSETFEFKGTFNLPAAK